MTEAMRRAPSPFYLVKQVELAAQYRIEAIVSPYGITTIQYTTLSVLARNPGMTSARLARNSFVRIQSMARTIALLEERGWIARSPDPRSRRQILLSLTDRGWDLVREIQPAIDAMEAEVFADFDRDEVAAFVGMLGQVRARIAGHQAH